MSIEGRENIGRPPKSFLESCEKSRKRKLKPLLENNSVDEIVLAAEMGLRSKGMRDAAHIVKEVSSTSPTRATRMKQVFQSPGDKTPMKIRSDKALAYFVDNKQSKENYISTRKICKEHNANIFPNYHILLEAKKRCYPEKVTITEFSAEVELQSLLDHTIQRLVSVQLEVLQQVRVGIDTLPTLNIIFKWGCDGASGQSQYKQRFSSETKEDNIDDAYIFMISLVPLQMTTYSAVGSSKSQKKIILWQNPLPSSTKYCRPIKIILKKETAELTKKEVDNIKLQISNLSPTTVHVEDREIQVTQEMHLTMIDGKIASVLLGQASQNCHLCGAKPSEMNNLDRIRQKKVNDTALMGLASLHAWIKFFECILHISYRLDIKCWQIRKERKPEVDARKKKHSGSLSQ